jgi:hypothetical protein
MLPISGCVRPKLDAHYILHLSHFILLLSAYCALYACLSGVLVTVAEFWLCKTQFDADGLVLLSHSFLFSAWHFSWLVFVLCL